MPNLKDLLNAPLSVVAKSTDGLIVTIYGKGGLGKTPVACKMDKPLYFAFGKSGLSGINNVKFEPVKSWSEFKAWTNILCDPNNYAVLHENYQTIILDEMEILYDYCTKFVANSEGVNRIKDGNGGYGLWQDLKTEWEREMLKVIGSGFTIMFILHTFEDDNGYNSPVGDAKRMLPILMNHSDIIGYVRSNGVDEDGKPIHSSLILADTDYCFARTRNKYFDPIIEDFTAENLIKAYYTAVDRLAESEGAATVSRETRDKMFETAKRDFEDVMAEVGEVGGLVAEKYGREKLTEIVEEVLGAGAMVSKCTKKQQEAVEVILMNLKNLLDAE